MSYNPSDINRVFQKPLNCRTMPYFQLFFRLPIYTACQSILLWCINMVIIQPSAYCIIRNPLAALFKYLPYNRSCLLTDHIIRTTSIHLISIRNRSTAIEHPFFLFRPKGASYFLGNIPCIHLMHKVFKRNKQKFSAAICISTIIPVNNGYKAHT